MLKDVESPAINNAETLGTMCDYTMVIKISKALQDALLLLLILHDSHYLDGYPESVFADIGSAYRFG